MIQTYEGGYGHAFSVVRPTYKPWSDLLEHISEYIAVIGASL